MTLQLTGQALGVPEDQVEGLLSVADAVSRSPELSSWVHSAAERLSGAMGSRSSRGTMPSLPNAPPEVAAYLPILTFMATLPTTRAFHSSRGISAEISRVTLADLGRAMTNNLRRTGQPGLGGRLTSWMTLHFTGAIYQLGRLQFERVDLAGPLACSVAAAGIPSCAGESALAVHIPARLGPMSAQACDESFAIARDFFATHFPEEQPSVCACISWLLDSQLGGYLPADSNIMGFQRRFQLWDLDESPAERRKSETDSDSDIRRMVFEDPRRSDDQQPRRSRLERAIIDHNAAGRHWHTGRGWVPWPLS
jgi:hypothetical protein